MKVVDWIITVCWVVFWLYWLVSALGAKSGRVRWGQWTMSRVGILVVLVIISRTRILHGHLASAATGLALPVTGLVVFLAGLGLAVWARIYLGGNWGMPMTEKTTPDLVTSGPYSRVRHPIYTGILLGMIGTGIAVSLWYLIVAVLLGGYFVYSARNEERYLASQFPDAYPEYKRSTKMLIPYVF